MASLDRILRKDLERTVKQARRVAEAGARKAIEQLGVGEAEVPKHLTTEQRALRNRLRAHGRQLGDRRDPRGMQGTAHLVQECAYEQWHRMLFARFLAETDLLIEPGSSVAITLDEVRELAREKATDWLPLASDYAERMLPQIFRKDDPVLQIALPAETRSALEDLLKGLTKPVFEADDSLGWVYQFWQSDKKDEVNKSEVKIGADELPAVTQLFTEDYMVLFLLHNTLGAWWAGKILADNPGLATSASDEAALRAACKVGDIDWTYLRFVRDAADDGTGGQWRPAAGVFEGWPKAAKDLTVLDPCMGSGHFPVSALPILVAFRVAEEGLAQAAAVDAVLRDNLFGLELDPRCTQLAAFNLAFAAWRMVGHRPLPQLNVACSGLTIGVTKAEWLRLAEKAAALADPAATRDLLSVERNLLTVGLEERVKNGLEALYDLFAKAPWLGSLIDPRRASGDIFREGFDKLEPLLSSILSAADTDDTREIAVAAQGMAKAAELLQGQFTLVATNVPYLGRGKQDDVLREYCDSRYPSAKGDVANCFLDRCLSYASELGTVGTVTPWNWTFSTNYQTFRETILKTSEISILVKVGEGGFESSAAAGAFVVLPIISRKPTSDTHEFGAIDLSTSETIDAKKHKILTSDLAKVTQSEQIKNPDARILFERAGSQNYLSNYAKSLQGIKTGDDGAKKRFFWEVALPDRNWEPFQSTVDETVPFGGCEYVVRWDDHGAGLARLQGLQAWGRKGVAVSLMRELRSSIYVGRPFGSNVAAIVLDDPSLLPALWAFCSSPEFDQAVRLIDPRVNAMTGSLTKVPFDVARWDAEARKKFPEGLPVASADDPTQWLFHGGPSRSQTPLQVAVSRLVGWKWPRQNGLAFDDVPAVADDQVEKHADDDGIVCLTALKGEPPAEQRLNALLSDAFGPEWSAAKLTGLLAEAGQAGKSLDDWLRDGFSAEHIELFQQRPFIWQIWDGRRDGFHALVNYHRLAAPNGEGRRTLEKLIYSYLGDWIDRQRADQTAGVEGADVRLAHAEHLKAELIKILDGEPPYDIFVRWKPLHEQPIGWDPDTNDGVRINIRPFMAARTLNARNTGACILRATPKIKWDKDRGKEPTRDKTNYPWFWGWDEAIADFIGGATFDGNRWNDLHFSRAVKQAARDRYRSKAGTKP